MPARDARSLRQLRLCHVLLETRAFEHRPWSAVRKSLFEREESVIFSVNLPHRLSRLVQYVTNGLLIRRASRVGTRRQISVIPSVWGFLVSSNIAYLHKLYSVFRLIRALAVETHENWIEANRYLDTSQLTEMKKKALMELVA